MDMNALFEPQQVAVIGASADPTKIGNAVVTNMLSAGYKGELYPVNPKGGTIEGLQVTTDIADLPDNLDMAVITVPRRFVLASLKELVARKVKSVVVISAGFKEVGKKGYQLEEELAAIARDNNIALLGPNCLGLMNSATGVNATFAPDRPDAGNIAFFSQSGALCVAILDWATGENIGFSKFVSLGNKAVLSEAHMLEYLAEDPDTKVILGYIENVEDGPRFMEAAKRISRKKPVIMIKSGTTAAGARAASSHTGAIAGSDQAYGAAFAQSGVIRVTDLQTLFHLAMAFSNQPLPSGPNLAIVTNSGGPGILAADATESSSLLMATLTRETIDQLKEFLPSYAAFYNPVDIIGDADAERYRKTLDAVLADENVHAVLVMLAPTATVDIEGTTHTIVEAAKATDKPVFASFMGKKRVGPGHRILQKAGIPCYSFPEPAIHSIEAMFLHSQWQNRPTPQQIELERDVEAARSVISQARRWGVQEIVEFQAQELLAAYNLPAPRTMLVRSSDEAVSEAEKLGYPIVMKIASAQISHKSDVKGVRVGLENAEQVREAFMDITNRARRLRPDAYINGCLLQEMAPKGCKEVIVGFKRDDQFGPLLMFGLGGIYVEALKDISFRLAPLSLDDAQELIREVRSYLLLKGFRGEPAVNFGALERIILIMARLALDFPEIYEAEFNPVLVNKDTAIVADVRLTLD